MLKTIKNYKPSQLPLTAVFVDYESWFWGLYNNFRNKPDIHELIKDIKTRGKLDYLGFFGDFQKDLIKDERKKIRTVTYEIFDCSNPNSEKEYTDFIMLHMIYQTILKRPDIEQYIFVTGDGHFSSVTAYLTTSQDKIIGVYGVKNSFSDQLQRATTWAVEILPDKKLESHAQEVLQNIHWAERNDRIPYFSATVNACQNHFGINPNETALTLSGLIKDGYIEQVEKMLPNGTPIRALVPKWDLIAKHGLYDPAQPAA